MPDEKPATTIWKFSLERADTQRIEMPAGAQPLSVQIQRGVPCLWCLVDLSAQPEERVFRIIGTGYLGPRPGATYIGTFQDGPMVFHLFEEK